MAILICPPSDLLKPYLNCIILIIKINETTRINFESCFTNKFILLITRYPVIKKKINAFVDLVSCDKNGVGKIKPCI